MQWLNLKRIGYANLVGFKLVMTYCKVVSSNTSRLEAHAHAFQIAYEGDFRSLCTVNF